MIRIFGAFLIIASLGCVSGAKAASINVKCAMNEDRVWVYESVVDFNLAAKLKCGDPVEIIGRVKGYVKIETQAGVEGYVADSAFPKSALPPEPVEKPNDVESASVAALQQTYPPRTQMLLPLRQHRLPGCSLRPSRWRLRPSLRSPRVLRPQRLQQRLTSLLDELSPVRNQRSQLRPPNLNR
jgi:hypothetical protein